MHIDQRALDLITSRCEGGSLSKRLYLQRLKKAHKKANRAGIGGFAVDRLKQDPQFSYWLCNARMMLGHYGDYSGWEQRGEGWSQNLWLLRPLGPPWDGRYTQKLYLLGEQGLGDEILFSQCIRDVIDVLGHRNIVLDTDPRLIPIFERSFGIECVPRIPISGSRPGMTAWMCLGDLLRLYRTGKSWNGSPYLKADPKRVKEFDWAKGFTAVSWKGNHGRYPVEDFVGAVGAPSVDVQYDASSELLRDPGIDKRNDLEGLAGLLSQTEKLVSVSTTVVHLAAGLGVPVDLVLAPRETGKYNDMLQWRWGLEGSKTPWYDSVTIYRSLKEYARLHVLNPG